MPLLVMCGIPASGKTKVANALKSYVEQNFPNRQVHIINEEAYNICKEDCYKDTKSEKDLRGFLRSNVDKLLTDENLVILDYMNYIKGFRYELFCLSRTVKSTYAVFFCEATIKDALANNKNRENGYSETLLTDLANRMERPLEKNRWDNPLFHAWLDEEPNFEEVCKALFVDKKKSKDPVSTKTEVKLGENYSYELDKSIQEVVNEVLKRLNENQMTFNHKFIQMNIADTEINLRANTTMNDLKKIKLDFVTANKMNPFKDTKTAKSGFAYFLKSRLSQ